MDSFTFIPSQYSASPTPRTKQKRKVSAQPSPVKFQIYSNPSTDARSNLLHKKAIRRKRLHDQEIRRQAKKRDKQLRLEKEDENKRKRDRKYLLDTKSIDESISNYLSSVPDLSPSVVSEYYDDAMNSNIVEVSDFEECVSKAIHKFFPKNTNLSDSNVSPVMLLSQELRLEKATNEFFNLLDTSAVFAALKVNFFGKLRTDLVDLFTNCFTDVSTELSDTDKHFLLGDHCISILLDLISSILMRYFLQMCSEFLKKASTYDFEILPSAIQLHQVLEARNELYSRNDDAVLTFHQFLLIAPLWKDFFLNRSGFDSRIVCPRSFIYEKRVGFCYLGCSYPECQFKLCLTIDFQQKLIRISPVSRAQANVHDHTLPEHINCTVSSYPKCCIKSLYAQSENKDPSNIFRTLQRLIQPNEETLIATNAARINLRHFEKHLVTRYVNKLKEVHSRYSSSDEEIVAASQAFEGHISSLMHGERFLSNTFELPNHQKCVVMAQEVFLKEMVEQSQFVVMDSTFNVTKDAGSKLFSLVYRDDYYDIQVGAVAFMITTECSEDIELFLSSVIKLACQSFNCGKEEIFQNLSFAVIDDCAAEYTALTNTFSFKNGYPDIRIFTCVFHKQKNFIFHIKGFHGARDVCRVMISAIFVGTEALFKERMQKAINMLEEMQKASLIDLNELKRKLAVKDDLDAVIKNNLDVDTKDEDHGDTGVQKNLRCRSYRDVDGRWLSRRDQTKLDIASTELYNIRKVQMYVRKQQRKRLRWAMCYRNEPLQQQIKSSQMVESIHNLYKSKVNGVGISSVDTPFKTVMKLATFFDTRLRVRFGSERRSTKFRSRFSQIGLDLLDSLPSGPYCKALSEFREAHQYLERNHGKRKAGRPRLFAREVIVPSESSTECRRIYNGKMSEPCFVSRSHGLPCKHIFLRYLIEREKDKNTKWFNQNYYLSEKVSKLRLEGFLKSHIALKNKAEASEQDIDQIRKPVGQPNTAKEVFRDSLDELMASLHLIDCECGKHGEFDIKRPMMVTRLISQLEGILSQSLPGSDGTVATESMQARSWNSFNEEYMSVYKDMPKI